jgi:hypothetical protein
MSFPPKGQLDSAHVASLFCARQELVKRFVPLRYCGQADIWIVDLDAPLTHAGHGCALDTASVFFWGAAARASSTFI